MEQRHKEALKTCLPMFVESVDPRDILRLIQCISNKSRQVITNKAEQRSTQDAATELYFCLLRRPEGFDELLMALRDPGVGRHDLADKLDPPQATNNAASENTVGQQPCVRVPAPFADGIENEVVAFPQNNGDQEYVVTPRRSTHPQNDLTHSLGSHNNLGVRTSSISVNVDSADGDKRGQGGFHVEETCAEPLENVPAETDNYPIQEEGSAFYSMSLSSKQEPWITEERFTDGQRTHFGRHLTNPTAGTSHRSLDSNDRLGGFDFTPFPLSRLPQPAWEKPKQTVVIEEVHADKVNAGVNDGPDTTPALMNATPVKHTAGKEVGQVLVSEVSNCEEQSAEDNTFLPTDNDQTNVKERFSYVRNNDYHAIETTSNKIRQSPISYAGTNADNNFNIGDTKPISDKNMERFLTTDIGQSSEQTTSGKMEKMANDCGKVSDHKDDRDASNRLDTICSIDSDAEPITEEMGCNTEEIVREEQECIREQRAGPLNSCENYIDYSLEDEIEARMNVEIDMGYSDEWRSIQNKAQKKLHVHGIQKVYGNDGEEDDASDNLNDNDVDDDDDNDDDNDSYVDDGGVYDGGTGNWMKTILAVERLQLSVIN